MERLWNKLMGIREYIIKVDDVKLYIDQEDENV